MVALKRMRSYSNLYYGSFIQKRFSPERLILQQKIQIEIQFSRKKIILETKINENKKVSFLQF